MSFKSKIKRGVAKAINKIAPAADVVLALPIIKRPTLAIAHRLIRRYSQPTSEPEIETQSSFRGPWVFSLDTPKQNKQAKRKVYISGWFGLTTSKQKPILRLVKPDGETQAINVTILRTDVAKALRKKRKIISDTCGFELTTEITVDGNYVFETLVGNTKKWKKVHQLHLFFDPDYLVGDMYNPDLSVNYAEHLNLVENKKLYFYEPASEQIFESAIEDPKTIAFYLPQFHRVKENDEWWGQGFTEWKNVTTATPRFIGHEQPKVPADLGFYDLKNEQNIFEQIQLAKKYGIHGFCFYYYWFSGQRLLESPLDSFLARKEWDFNFMICWANENWTRRWDGRQEDILVAQEHKQSDPLDFIKDVEKILLDPRYIRVDDKPVLLVYRANDLLEPGNYATIWRKYFQEKHGLDLHLVAVQSFDFEDPQTFNFDKGLEFVPLSVAAALDGPLPVYDISQKVIDKRFSGSVHDYREIALSINNTKQRFSSYKCVMPSWDNDARKKGAGGIFYNSNPDLYAKWLRGSIEATIKQPGDNIIFLNAWNEWAEGAYLEPDTQYGHAYLKRTAQILAEFSASEANKGNFPMYDIKRQKSTKLAVIVHLYYADLWGIFQKRLSLIGENDFDLFVSIPQKNAHMAEIIASFKPNVHITIVPNRGRDVLPFIHLSRRLKEAGYEYVLKLHSKKSKHREDGDTWLKDMLEKLIPENSEKFMKLQKILQDDQTGIIGPEDHFISLDVYFGLNRGKIKDVLAKKYDSNTAKNVIRKPEKYGFFAGTMFWARLDALGGLLDEYYQVDDFESEKGQLDGTLAHALERLFCLLPELDGKKLYTINGGAVNELIFEQNVIVDYEFAERE